MRRRTHKFIQAAAMFGGARDHRKPQIRGKLVEVIPHALLFRLIEQIDADNDLWREFRYLQNKRQIPPQAQRVAHHDHAFRTAEADKIPCDLLFRRTRTE